MQAVSGGIAHGVHPAVEVGEGRGVVEELVENGVDSLRVGLWAHAAIVGADGREGHLKVERLMRIDEEGDMRGVKIEIRR